MNRDLPDLNSSFVFSCNAAETWGVEQFYPEHILACQLSGETHLYYENRTFVLKKNQVFLAQKNQMAKSFKTPASDAEYRALGVFNNTSYPLYYIYIRVI